MEKKVGFLKGKEVLVKSADGSIVICHELSDYDDDLLYVNTKHATTQEERDIVGQVAGVEREISIGRYYHVWAVAALYDSAEVAEAIVKALEASRTILAK